MASIQPTGRPSRPRRRWWRFVLGAAALWWLAGLVGAFLATRGRAVAVPAQAEIAGRPAESVSALTGDGLNVCAWLVRASEDSLRCVVLAAGIRGNRTVLTSRAAWYLEHGWSTLLVDLRGTGESDAARISMGWYEARDLHAWRTFLRSRGFARIGVHGQSLGAAAIAYSDGDWAFAVFESCYADVDEALAARLPWVPWPRLVLWPLRQCSEWLLGVDIGQLRPVERVAHLRAPALFLCGDTDSEVGPDAAARLTVACGGVGKRCVIVPGAGHEDLLDRDGETVRAALAAFVPQ
jgi:pimeloyl-ACP methyl ester carboxylesterase